VSRSFDDSPRPRPRVGTPWVTAWERPLGASIIDVALTPNASVIVAGCVNRRIAVFNCDGVEEWSRPARDEVWAVAVTADAHRIAAGTASKNPASGCVSVYDRDGRPVWQYNVGAPVWGVAFSADGRYLVAGSWNNNVYLFEADGEQYALRRQRTIGTAGVYGTAMSADGSRIVVSAYEDGVHVLDRDLNPVGHYPDAAAAYRVAVSRDGARVTAGLRGGEAGRIENGALRILGPVASRTVCGVAIAAEGPLWLAGSFDGTVTLAQADGLPLWTMTIGSEIWSVAATSDAGVVVFAAADGVLRKVVNAVTTTAWQEIASFEAAATRRSPTWADRRSAAVALRDCYARYGIIAYSVTRLEEWRGILGDDITDATLMRLLLDDITDHPASSFSHFRLARYYAAQRQWQECARHYLEASRDPTLKLISLTGAGDAFMQVNWNSAAQACYRRAREQDISLGQKQVLYNLARSYEDAGQHVEARKHYEVLVTWDPAYRDAWERARATAQIDSVPRLAPDSDYTGLTVSLLGPDVPRANEVDASLRRVLDARAKEFAVTADDRRRLYGALQWHLSSAQPWRAGTGTLSYDVAAYMKYDYLLPEDEIKKELELLNLLAAIDGASLRRSLDIGAATGRHPRNLASRGIAAFGVDIELEAMAYARAGCAKGPYPQFTVGDGRQLPFRDDTFDLVTCMMGTIAHMPAVGQEQLFRDVARLLAPDGLFVVSTWDVDCRHLAFLSMYTHAQKEMIRRNSMTRHELTAALRRSGFAGVQTIPFALLPETFTFEWGVQGTLHEYLARVLEVDLAARGAYPQMHGEMFMTVASVKPTHEVADFRESVLSGQMTG
jgi:SAM-dependent methyltransferase